MDIFCKKIAEIRKGKGLNQADVAKVVHVSQSRYSAYENGKLPPFDIAIQLAQYFHVSLDYLTGLPQYQTDQTTRADQAVQRLARIPQQDGVDHPVTPQVVGDLVDALIAYVAADLPSGVAPVNTAGVVLRAVSSLLECAAGDSIGELIDAANALAVAGLSAQDSIKAYVGRDVSPDEGDA